jgi:hypothetical protein
VENTRSSTGSLPEQGVQRSSPPSEGSPHAARALLARPARGFVRFLYSSNPFYILSADLVFVGLRMSFGPGGPAERTWALGQSLAGYTLLLAITACFLIRVGKLWDDLRSLLLLIVMMFLAMATSGDDTMAADSRRGAIGYLVGFVFAVVVTEAVLHAIRLRLPGWYRAAYHAILAVVFLYPIALAPFLSKPESPRLQWALFWFSPLAALALCLLVPAAKGGRAYVAKNGSPWRWPLYPWSLFFVIVGGVAVRCYSLCVSFHYVNGNRTIFGPYFLVPIGLAVSLIWLEIGIAGRRLSVMFLASVTPFLLAFLATTGHRYEPIYMNFLDMFQHTLGGTPFYLTVVASVVFLAYAVYRKVPAAWDLLSVALAVLAAVGPRSLDLNELVALRPLPLAAAGFVLASVAWRGRHSFRALVAGFLLAVAGTRACISIWPSADWAMIGLQLLIVAWMTVGAAFADGVGRFARTCACAGLLALGVGVAARYPLVVNSLPEKAVPWYPMAITVVAGGYGWLLRDRRYVAVAAATFGTWVPQLRRVLAGLDQIVFGLFFFVVAAAISFRKAGIWPRTRPKWFSWLLKPDELSAWDEAVPVKAPDAFEP